MYVDKQKRFERFIRVSLPKFSDSLESMLMKFLLIIKELLYNLNFITSHGVDYSTYQLNHMPR